MLCAGMLVAGVLSAQQQPLASQPDCVVANNLPVPNGNGIVPLIGNQYFDNRGFMCTLWAISYRADSAVTGFTVSLQSAEGSQTPGTFGAFAGTKLVGTTSFGTASSGAALYTSLPSSGTAGDVPWIRVNVASGSGDGYLFVTLMGWRSQWGAAGGGGGGGGGSSGCVGTVMTPCAVEGVAGNGSATAGNPVWICGTDGTDCRAISTDSSGHVIMIGAGTAGTANSGVVTIQGIASMTPVIDNLTEWAGTALAVPTAWGTAPSGNVPGVNANILSQTPPLGASTFTSGQQAVTASAANLGTNTAKSVCVHALIGNTINVYAGASGVTTSTGMEIPPGQGFCWNVSNTNLIYVIASTTGAWVSVTWTN
jgi:hypothetical protein